VCPYILQGVEYPSSSTLRSFIQSQIFPSSLTRGIQVGPLSQTNSALTCSWALSGIVICRSMVDTSVVPNGEIIRILPSVTNLDVMILRNQCHEPI
jgi:hypothetical protein